MSKPKIWPTVDDVVRGDVKVALKERGYQHNGRGFFRYDGELVQSIYFQAARGAPFMFAVDLTLMLPYCHELVFGEPFPMKPTPFNAAWITQTRVSYSTADGPSHWWHVTADGLPALKVGVAAAVVEALPYFLRWPTVESLVESMQIDRQGEFGSEAAACINLALLMAFRGQRARALELLGSIQHRSSLVLQVEERLKVAI